MPLHAVTASGTVLRSWEITLDDWEALKREHRDLGLTASCCGAAVVPVRSSRGWQFFRHQADAACSVHETPEHVVCKTIIARTAAGLGFEARTETRAPDGAWTADVLVRRPEWAADTAIALEVQLSRVAMTEIENRQERYEAAGVRAAWLVGFHLPGTRPRRDLPLFRLVTRQQDEIAPVVLCRSADGGAVRIGLAAFTEALLCRRIRFDGPPADVDRPAVGTIPSQCWRCRRDVELTVGFANVRHAIFAPHGFLPASDLHKIPELLAAYRSGLGALCAASDALTVLRPPPPAKETEGMRAHCPGCDAPISLRRLPPHSNDPTRWGRCWTFDGKEWAAEDQKTARWVVIGA